MDFSSLGQSAKNDAQGLAGNIAKAVLVFVETELQEVRLEDFKAVKAYGASRGMNSLQSHDRMNELLAAGKTKISKTAVDTSATVSALEGLGGDQDSLTAAMAAGRIKGKKFTVQFNPASLRITARGGGRYPISNYGAAGDNQACKIEYRALDPYITVGFTLIFDATNLADAFMEERFTLGVTTVAKNVATAAVGREYTVRPQVEGFLAALRDEAHRTMIFQWGSLRYTGVLNTVNCRYTMFNTVGNPIRAEVQLSMLMATAPDTMDGASYLDYWKQRYRDIIQKHGKKDGEQYTSMDTGTIKNQYNNLINL